MCMCVYHVCAMCLGGAHGCQKMVSSPLELEPQFELPSTGAEGWQTQATCSQGFRLTSPRVFHGHIVAFFNFPIFFFFFGLNILRIFAFVYYTYFPIHTLLCLCLPSLVLAFCFLFVCLCLTLSGFYYLWFDHGNMENSQHTSLCWYEQILRMLTYKILSFIPFLKVLNF